MKIITTALVAMTAVAALSACATETTGADSSGTGTTQSDTSTKAGKKKPSYTPAQENAIRSAKSYLQMSGMSRDGLVDQLSSKAGDGFKRKDAVFAVNHMKVDWNKEAVEAAKSYLEMGGMSRSGLIQQLSSNAGDKFTPAQAKYAADKVGL